MLQLNLAPNAAADSAPAATVVLENGAPPPVRAIVAASVRLYRDGLAHSLGAAMHVVAQTGDAPATLAAAGRLCPDVVLLDVALDGALALVRSIYETVPTTRMVAFAVDDRAEHQVLAYAEAGVAGWIGRDATAAEVVDSVLRAARGELLCSARTAALLTRRLAALARERPPSAPSPGTPLTPREAEIGELLSQGLSNKHIARALGLRLATVKNHVHNILEKLEVRSRGEAGARLRSSVSIGA
ncbi:LuxR C-terminal-related transcriptional regulator [Longimicrobium sp.]|uniref:LuxR C-terminal-related transcriptional regulator n=1 Tax=Longimicrobium sp. TaxID=2029185 RepID=UPI003B3A0E8D